MGCGQLALTRANISYDNYYASEIDKYAVIITKHHFPNTIHLGSVLNVKGSELPKIDLLIGGSPCKGFSVAGNGLNFNHPESKLFFEYVRILFELRIKNTTLLFLLENVKMKKEWEIRINKILGCRPIRLNSNLVSAQERNRLYWTNIPVNNAPKNKRQYLKDIIESGHTDRLKSFCIDANYYKGGSLKNYYEKSRRQLVFHQSERRLMVKDGQHRMLTVKECCRLQTVPDDYFEGIVSNSQAYKMLGNGWTVDIIVHILNHIQK